jgi:hypothetical protein
MKKVNIFLKLGIDLSDVQREFMALRSYRDGTD